MASPPAYGTDGGVLPVRAARLVALVERLSDPFSFDDVVRALDGTGIAAGEALRWWSAAKTSGLVVRVGVRPQSRLRFVGPAEFTLARPVREAPGP